jgi:hypothetical protein
MVMNNQLTTEQGLAEVLPITTKQIQKLRRSGQIPYIRVNHRKILYSIESVVQALKQLEISK